MNTGRESTRYEPDVMRKIKFFDDNTQMFWTPQTGGGHVPGDSQGYLAHKKLPSLLGLP